MNENGFHIWDQHPKIRLDHLFLGLPKFLCNPMLFILWPLFFMEIQFQLMEKNIWNKFIDFWTLLFSLFLLFFICFSNPRILGKWERYKGIVREIIQWYLKKNFRVVKLKVLNTSFNFLQPYMLVAFICHDSLVILVSLED